MISYPRYLHFVIPCLLLAMGAWGAEPAKWRARNNSQETVKVYWTASGCTGIKSACVDGSYINAVCKVRTLGPGESGAFRFPTDTSSQGKTVCRKSGSSRQKNHADWVSQQGKTGIRLNSGGLPEWYRE